MIIEGEELKRHNYVEVKQVKEVRTGRHLMCRKVTIKKPTSSNDDNTSKGANILFIHGGLGASRQFDALVGALSKDKSNNKRIDCYLYDQLGCGESKHPPDDWDAYSSIEHREDMLAITKSIITSMHNDSQLYVAAHSYGVSQTIKLLNVLETDLLDRVGGAILIGGGLKDSPSNLTKDGGHWIFKMPIFMLKIIQPTLSKNFVDAAFYPNNKALKEIALECSNRNHMAICKASYRQQQYATSEEARAVKVSCLISFECI